MTKLAQGEPPPITALPYSRKPWSNQTIQHRLSATDGRLRSPHLCVVCCVLESQPSIRPVPSRRKSLKVFESTQNIHISDRCERCAMMGRWFLLSPPQTHIQTYTYTHTCVVSPSRPPPPCTGDSRSLSQPASGARRWRYEVREIVSSTSYHQPEASWLLRERPATVAL